MRKGNTSSISMGKSAIDSRHGLGIILGLTFLTLGGCSGSKKPVIIEPILLEREAEVSIRYYYDVITLTAPVRIVHTTPTAFRFGLYQRVRPAEPFIERVFFPGEPIQVILPRAIFSSDTLGNMAVLDPMGGNYRRLEQLFTLASSPEQILVPFVVKSSPHILKIFVLKRIDERPVSQAEVVVSDGKSIFGSGITDSLGYTRIEIERAENPREFLRVSVRTGGDYPPWSGNVPLTDKATVEKTVWLGTSTDKENGGVFYKVVTDLVPLREGPENGASTIFFLSTGDRVYVTRVAGDRLYGTVEVFTSDPNVSREFSGWVLNKFVQVVE